MARPLWSGSISFGLVNVPVKAYTAVRDHSVHFHQLDRHTGARVEYQKVSSKTGKVLDAGDIDKGYEIAKGNYVVVDEDELADLRPHSTRTIDITDFVDLAAIDPMYYEHTYWLGADGEAAERAYGLLHAAMDEAQRVGIGTVVIRNKQYLAAVRPLGRALALSTMRFADEIVPSDGIDGVPGRSAPQSEAELRLASRIIDALSNDWDPERYHDTYTDELRDLIEAKAEGREITVEAAELPSGEVVDLLAALQASVDSQRKRRGAASSRPAAAKATRSRRAATTARPKAEKAASRKAPAKKASAKKAPAGARKKSA